MSSSRAFHWRAASISSTTIVAKAFAEQRVGADLRELALGVLLCEDLVAVIMLAV